MQATTRQALRAVQTARMTSRHEAAMQVTRRTVALTNESKKLPMVGILDYHLISCDACHCVWIVVSNDGGTECRCCELK